MKIKLNPIRRLSILSEKNSSAPEDTVPAAGSAQRQPSVCVRSSRIKLQIRSSRDSATVCSITNPCRIKGGTLCCQRNWLPFRVPWGWTYTAGTVADWMAQFSFGFYSLMLTSLLLGLIVMVLYKPRTWCAFCPMGTMTQGICKLKNKE